MKRICFIIFVLFDSCFALTKVGAICKDGTIVSGDDASQCSSHGGVHLWLAKDSDNSSDTLQICSFNIQFLGHFKNKNNSGLADILQGYDIVVVQELVAPPWDGKFPDNEDFKTDPESKAFFDAMTNKGFESILSEEDTGPGDEIHKNTTATEWWCAFYKPHRVQPASDIPHGFLAEDRSKNPDWERVPYAFSFRDPNQKLDFVLISVHLAPGSSSSNKERRFHELKAIKNWIDQKSQKEKDFIILGDMNIEDLNELQSSTPQGYLSLNDEFKKTNTATGSDKAYDHVMYSTQYTSRDIDTHFDIKIVDLIKAAQPTWTLSSPYPGNPYNHDQFRQFYSDHHPVVFRMVVRDSDDD